MPSTRAFTVTRREAARRLGVHPETLRRWATAGKIEFDRSMSGQMWFDPDDLERLRLRVHGVVRTGGES